MPQISVIVPIYKVEQYIYRCIDSILNQSFRDFELILVDDGSPDRCGMICDEYAEKDSRIHVIHRKNGGLSAARNSGIDWVFRNSDSQWLTFIDSDDWIHPRMLECMLGMVKKWSVKVSVCGYKLTSGETTDLLHGNFEGEIWTPEDFYIEHNVNSIVAWGKLYHRDFFKKLRYPKGKLHEDEFTTYRILFQEKKIAVSDLPMYFYFQNTEGITKSKWKPKRLDGTFGLGKQAYYFKKHGFKRAYAQAAYYYALCIFQGRERLKNCEAPRWERVKYGLMLNLSLKRAVCCFSDIYLPEERGHYVEAFPFLTATYRFLKAIVRKIIAS